MATEINLDRLRERLAKETDFAASLNILFWEGVREHVAELPPDQRHQAEDALDLLIDLLRNEDDGESES